MELTEILIANYNGTPHGGINNFSPLEVMRDRIARGMPVRLLPEEKRDELNLLAMQAKRKVAGNVRTGRRPYVQFEGVPYRSEVLARSPHLIGTELTLLINVEDLRVIRVFLPDGSELGLLSAAGKWGVRPHSLKTRREINKLRERKLIHFISTDDPIEVYERFLRTQSKTQRSARNKMEELARETTQTENAPAFDLKKHEVNDSGVDILQRTEQTAKESAPRPQRRTRNCKYLLENRSPGGIIYGRPRLGKTRAIHYLTTELQENHGSQLPVFMVNCRKYKYPSEITFFEDLL